MLRTPYTALNLMFLGVLENLEPIYILLPENALNKSYANYSGNLD